MRNLEKSRQISKILISLESLDNLDKNIDAAKSRFKSLDFINLDSKVSILKILTEKKKSCLDSKDNLDTFQKLISTDQEILTDQEI